jgi:hypothetical protein
MPVPVRVSSPPRRRIEPRSPHLCLEVREEAIYWASAQATRRGLEPLAWGCIARDASQGIDQQIAALAAGGLGRDLRCEAALRAAGTLHERTQLRGLSRKEVRAVARRRVEEFADRIGSAACTAWLRTRHRQDVTLWLAGVGGKESEECREKWLRRGFTLSRLQSRHLALGQLTRCLPALAEGEVIAIFDIEPETGTCVLADRNGWLFSREVPLRFMGRAVEAHAVPAAEAVFDEGPSGLELATAAGREQNEDDLDPLEDIAVQAERLATELRRTFRYVEGQLGSAPVSRVILAGEITELIDLSPGLSEHLGLPVEVLAESAQGDERGRPVGGAAVVLGMACAPDRRGGNLLAEPVQRAIADRRLRTYLLRALAAAMLLVVAGGLATALQTGSLRYRPVELDAIWNAAEAMRARLAANRLSSESARAIEDALAALDAPMPSPVALLTTLALAMPDEAALQRLHLEPDDAGLALTLTVEAGGTTLALAAQSVSELARDLAAAPFVHIDRVEREASAGAPSQPDAAARLRFRLEGRLAVIEPCTSGGAP